MNLNRASLLSLAALILFSSIALYFDNHISNYSLAYHAVDSNTTQSSSPSPHAVDSNTTQSSSQSLPSVVSNTLQSSSEFNDELFNAMRLIDRGIELEGGVNLKKVDLVLRTFRGHIGFLPLMLHTIDLLWPRPMLGDVIVVVDAEADDFVMSFISDELRRFGSLGKIIQLETDFKAEPGYRARLSNWEMVLWGDRLGNSDNIMLLDSDAPFLWRISPETIFRNGKLIVIGRRCGNGFHCIRLGTSMASFNRDSWDETKHGDFMRQIPMPVPRAIFPSIRETLVNAWNEPVETSWPRIYQAIQAQEANGYHVAHLDVLGNYMLETMPDKIAWSWEVGGEPAIRVTSHAGYEYKEGSSKLSDRTHAGILTTVFAAACISIPPEFRSEPCKFVSESTDNPYNLPEHEDPTFKSKSFSAIVDRLFYWYDCGFCSDQERAVKLVMDEVKANWRRYRLAKSEALT